LFASAFSHGKADDPCDVHRSFCVDHYIRPQPFLKTCEPHLGKAVSVGGFRVRRIAKSRCNTFPSANVRASGMTFSVASVVAFYITTACIAPEDFSPHGKDGNGLYGNRALNSRTVSVIPSP
jgi:hypothetical protein